MRVLFAEDLDNLGAVLDGCSPVNIQVFNPVKIQDLRRISEENKCEQIEPTLWSSGPSDGYSWYKMALSTSLSSCSGERGGKSGMWIFPSTTSSSGASSRDSMCFIMRVHVSILVDFFVSHSASVLKTGGFSDRLSRA